MTGRGPGGPRRLGVRRPWPPFVHAVATALLLGLLPTTVAAAVAAEAEGTGRPELPASERAIAGGDAPVRPRPADPAADGPVSVPEVHWPEAGAATLTAPDSTARLTASGSPVRLLPAPGAARQADAAPAPEAARLEILDRDTGRDAGVRGLLFTLAAEPPTGARAAGAHDVAVEVDYTSFAQAYGGSYGARLRLVQLPDCALTTPERPECRIQTPLRTANETADRTLTTADPLRLGTTPVVLAADADDSGETGDFQATELAPSSSWSVGLNTGDLTWSYDMAVPAVPGGLEPSVNIGYSSGSIDGRTSSTNNQSSWVGDGFELWPGYIERSYHSCADEGLKRGGADVPDLCWAYDNATISLGGASGDLVPTGTSTWRLREDDGTRVERLTNSTRANGDNDNEYWKVTTPDGTQYFFGYNRLPGWTTGSPETASTWNVPVYGNNTGEPCRTTTFVNSWCQQAWRWNLDYVVDPRGNAMAYYYERETNSYGRYLEAADDTPYTRGGVLKRIDYGLRSDALFATPPARVVFQTGERCLPATGITCAAGDIGDNPSPWYDTPWDLNCTAGTDCDEGRHSPTFWTRNRLVSVTTQSLNASGTLVPVDTWQLTHRWGTADIDWTLLPTSITRTGRSTTPEITLPPVEFVYEQGANRLDRQGDGTAPFIKHRLSTITDETGGQVDVTYSAAACDHDALPTVQTNTTRCFPQYWTPSGATDPQREWFNKYVVTRTVSTDRTGGAPDMYTDYSYQGGAAWHFDDDDGLTEPEQKTWSQWRGYGEVRVRTGGPGGMTTRTDHWFLRGMDGDRAGPDGGTKDVTVPDGEGGTLTDHEAHAGFTYRTATWSAPDGQILSRTLNVPWHHETASRTRDWGTVTAHLTGTSSQRAFTSLDNGAGDEWREVRTDTTHETVAGRAVRVADLGDAADPDDDRCATTAFAENTEANILTLVARARSWTGSCSSEPTTAARVISDTRTLYDNHAYGAAPTRGDPTGVQTIDGLNGGVPTYRTSGGTYDVYGRPLTATDPAGRTTTTAYSPATGRPAKITVTTPPAVPGTASTSQVTTTDYDVVRGLPLRTTDTNGLVTTQRHDALGRLLRVWLPNASTSGTPSYQYTYRVAEDAITAVGVTSPMGIGTRTDWTLYDGLLRPRQTQSAGPDGGRLLTDTLYDDRGQTARTFASYYATGGPRSSLYAPAQPGAIESQTAFTYDGLGRVLTERQISGNGDGTTTEWARATYTYNGDRVSVDPVDGATATTTVSDARGQTTELWQHHGPTPTGAHDVTRYGYNPRGELTHAEDPAGNEWSWEYDILGRLVESDDPDAGTTTRTYNSRDELVTVTDARGETVHHTYDNLGRKTATRSGSATGPLLTSWTWDTLREGQLTSSTRYDDGAAYTMRIGEYDTLYRARSTQVVVPEVEGEEALAGTYRTGTEYNLDGTVQSTAYPRAGGLAGEVVVPAYDSIRRITGLTGSGNATYVGDVIYSHTGKPLQYTLLGGGTRSTWVTSSYEWGTQRLHDSRVDREDVAGVDRSVTYAYDDAGNVLSMADVSAVGTDNQCFRYDHLRRMTEAWTERDTACTASPSAAAVGGPAPYWTSHTFDAVGNRTEQTDHALAPGGQDTVTTYTYAAAGGPQPHTLTSTTTEGPGGTSQSTYTYDDAGNTTLRRIGGDDQTLDWDAEGRVRSITGPEGTTSFVYDADGNRLLRRTADETVLYLAGTEVVLHRDDTVEARRFYDLGGGNTAVRGDDGTVHLQLADHHGTVELSVETGTGAVNRRGTTPYGGSRGDEPASWPDERGFVGGTQDPTGLIHLGARLYDPALGRFLSVDPVLDLTDPQQINGYAYSNNNPVSFSDPTGLRLDCGIDSASGTPCPRHGAIDGTGKRGLGPRFNTPAFWRAHPMDTSGGRTDSVVSHRNDRQSQACACDWPLVVAAVTAEPVEQEDTGGGWGWLGDAVKVAVNAGAEVLGVNDAVACVTEGDAMGCAMTGLSLATLGWGRAAAAGVRYADDVANLADDAARHVDDAVGAARSCARHSFLAGTDVLMADGTREDIDDIEVGDTVIATDPETGETGPRTVTATIITDEDKDYTELTIETAEDGSSTLVATAHHPFWNATTKTWTNATDLTPGTNLHTPDGTLATITTTHTYTGTARTYDLTIADLHTYHVLAGETPVLVHNCPNGPGGTSDRDVHGVGRTGERGVDVAHVWENGDMYIQEDGQIVRVLSNGNGSYDVVVRDMGNPSGAPTTAMKDVSEQYVQNQIDRGRWE
ncbi:polymorphic toxin-type HINT domain-containing protein [Streptomyces sp. NPDC049881]|uniref:polymorphic toxin-type HINT domain-containing protein n=1 Tax=Streptomyces sp. NPDC049881 TaxID=3155778 RepID=UPI0034489570